MRPLYTYEHQFGPERRIRWSMDSNPSASPPMVRPDWLGDLLYVPEALYCIGLTVVLLAGPGPWSLDAAIAALVAD
jgi:hypothetical protein